MTGKVELATLVAFADGELSSAEHARVEALLVADPEARKMVAELRQGAKLVRSAYDDPAIQEVPGDLRVSIEGLLAAAPDSRKHAPPLAAGSWSSWFPSARLALTTALIALAAAGGYLMAEWRFERRLAELEVLRNQDRQFLQDAIGRALEKHLSGQAVEWRNPMSGNRGEVVPVRTFRSEAGQWCREYREVLFLAEGEEVRYAIACRHSGGEWRTRLRFLGDG